MDPTICPSLDADIRFWADIGKTWQCLNYGKIGKTWQSNLKYLLKDTAYRDDEDKTVSGDNPSQWNAHSGRFSRACCSAFKGIIQQTLEKSQAVRLSKAYQ
jgi:hypothetical protein